MKTPEAEPLPASSRKLRDHRYQADVARRNGRGTHTVYAVGRFEGFGEAVAWADRVHPEAVLVTVTYYSARNGWQGHHWALRRDGEWRTRGA